MRCITSHQLLEQYGQNTVEVVDASNSKWCLLVASLDKILPVDPGSLLVYLKIIRTLVGTNNRLCFHLADPFQRNPFSQHWQQLIAITFCRQTKVRY